MINRNQAINYRIEIPIFDKKNIPDFVKVGLPTEIKFAGVYDPNSFPTFHNVVYMIYQLKAFGESTAIYEFQHVVVK